MVLENNKLVLDCMAEQRGDRCDIDADSCARVLVALFLVGFCFLALRQWHALNSATLHGFSASLRGSLLIVSVRLLQVQSLVISNYCIALVTAFFGVL